MTATEDRARSIFLAALDRAPDGWPALLEETCRGDADLRARVDQLLHAHQALGSIHRAEEYGPTTAVDGQVANGPGTVIGPYKLVEVIGEGGMGTVFLAQQHEPVKRLVALKVIKPGMDTRQVIARFEAERQALALMDHPNIARVLDGGTTTAGRPYFVMDLVKGVPITRYCDEHRLTPRQRLELFVPICHAVEHAHQKGVIHRDIKPTNVLVAPYDGRPVPKVIDFGVAKAAGQSLTEKTLVTGLGAVVGTPEYMSPEQAELNQLDIDTRSDIYSLGVLLYELLTGTTPLEHQRFRETGLLEALRIIREEEVPTLGNRLGTTAELPAIAAHRGLDPGRLTRLVRGELNWIVMRALEKDRARRYQTAGALAADVQQYLADGPVQACPPSAAYRLRKFARRNRGGLAVAGLVLTFIGLTGAGAGWVVRDRAARLADADRENAARAADKDREVAQGLSDAARAREGRRWAEAREAVKRVEWLLAGGGRPDQRQDLRDLVGDLDMVARLEEIRLQQGDTKVSDFAHADADPAYAGAFRTYGLDIARLDPAAAAERIRASAIHTQLVIGLDDWAWVKARTDPDGRTRLLAVARQADPDEWRNLLRDAAAQKDRGALAKLAARPEAARLPPATAVFLARTLAAAGLPQRAVDVLADAHLRHPDDLWVNTDLSVLLLWRVSPPRRAEALGYARAALALRPNSAGLYVRVGDATKSPARLDEAIAAYRKANELQPGYAVAYKALGAALAEKGDWEAAIAAYEEGIRLAPKLSNAHRYLALAYQKTGQWDKAITALREATRLWPADATAEAMLAWRLVTHPDPGSRDIPQALERARKAVQLAPKDGNAWDALGAACYRAGDWAGAIAALEKARTLFGPRGSSTYQFAWLAMAHWQQGDKAAARAWYDRSAEWLQENGGRIKDDAVLREYDLRRLHEEAAELLGIEPRPAKASERAPAKSPDPGR